MRLISIIFFYTILFIFLPEQNGYAQSEIRDQAFMESELSVIAEKLTLSREYLPNYPDSSLQLIDEILLRDSVHQNDSLFAVAKYVAGTAYYFKDYYNLAIDNYKEALNTDYSSRDESFRVRIYNNLGVFYDNLLQHDEALKYYKLALEIEERRGDPGELSDVFINIGLVYHSIGDVDEALDNFFKAEELIIDLPLSFRHGLIQQNLGMAYQTIGRIDDSIEATQNAISIFNDLNIYRSKLQSMHNLVDVLINTGEPEKARVIAFEAIENADEYGIPVQKALLTIHLARIEISYGNAKAAIDYLDEARQIFLSLEDPYETYPLSIFEIKMEAYAMLGDSEKVMSVFREYQDLRQERDVARQATAINELNLRLEVSENLARLQEQSIELRQQKTILIIVIVFSIILFAALISMVLFYRNKEKANRLLAESKNELEKVNSEKDRLLSILAHDIRAPLSNLQGVVFLIQEGITKEVDLTSVVNEIEHQLHQGITMLSNYLQWAQNQKNGINVNLEPIDLKEISNQIADELKTSADKKEITIELNLSDGLTALADKNLMQVILRNLISNAIKYENNGGTIKIDSELKGERILLNVTDHGIGIPNDKQGSIFEPFSKTSKGTLGESGTGLGLSICKEFTEKQGGNISFQTKQNEGTTFTVELKSA